MAHKSILPQTASRQGSDTLASESKGEWGLPPTPNYPNYRLLHFINNRPVDIWPRKEITNLPGMISVGISCSSEGYLCFQMKAKTRQECLPEDIKPDQWHITSFSCEHTHDCVKRLEMHDAIKQWLFVCVCINRSDAMRWVPGSTNILTMMVSEYKVA